MSATSPSASAYVLLIASARISAAMRPACSLSVVKNEVKALESAAESMPMILTFLAASSIGLASGANCAGAVTTAAGVGATAVSGILILPSTSGFGWGP